MEDRDARIVDTGGAELHCWSFGDGPLVILAHGFPDCAHSFRLQVPALVAAGYRCVVPALRGYAPSSRAHDGRYDLAALGNDLVALARHFAPGQAVRLVGHDWGALAAYAAVALAPGAFSHVATLAVPPLGPTARHYATPAQLRRSWYVALFQLPGAERLLARRDFALVERLWRDWSPGFVPPPVELESVKAALRGREADVLAYYRALRRPSRSLRRLLWQPIRVPGLYIHGESDGCVGVKVATEVDRAYVNGVTVQRVAGGHFVHQENPEACNRLLIEFFKQTIGKPLAVVQ